MLKSANYVMVGKKRGLESLKSVENLSTNADGDNAKESNVDKARSTPSTDLSDNKKSRISSLSNVNIIDVISCENFREEKIACNEVEMIREKTKPLGAESSLAVKSQYIYDIYYTKNEDIHLDLLYPNNFQIKSYNNYQDVDLVEDTNPVDGYDS